MWVSPLLRKICMSFIEGGPYYIYFLKKEEKALAEYASNSDKSKELVPVKPEGKLEPVISGTATVQKKTGLGKFASSIIVEDIRSVGSYILTDVLLPAVKKAISDITVNGIDMLLYGKTGVTKPATNAPRISYGSYYAGNTIKYGSTTEPKTQYQVHNSAFDIDTIIYPTRGDAEAVLETMGDLLDSRQVVSVGDLYDLSKIETTNYMVERYGWTNLRGAEVVRRGDGYILSLPKIVEINTRRK